MPILVLHGQGLVCTPTLRSGPEVGWTYPVLVPHIGVEFFYTTNRKSYSSLRQLNRIAPERTLAPDLGLIHPEPQIEEIFNKA